MAYMEGPDCRVDNIRSHFPNANEMQLGFSDDLGLHNIASVALDKQTRGKVLTAFYGTATRVRGKTMLVRVSARH
jgi:hypothetical protein